MWGFFSSNGDLLFKLLNSDANPDLTLILDPFMSVTSW